MKKQKSIISTLTKRSFRQNKGRNLVAVLAIIMTTMMFTTLFTLAQSMEKNMTEMYLRQSGTSAHATCKQITDEQIKQIASHPDVAAYGTSIVLGIAENQQLSGRQVEIRYGDDTYAEWGFAYPAVGHMPRDRQEIALDTLTLERLGVPRELGAAVTLAWRADLTSDEITEDTFTLCGWWEGNQSVYAGMAWVSREFALDACGGVQTAGEGQILGQRMMNLMYRDSANIEEQTDQILEDCGLTSLEFNTNLAYGPEMQYSIRMENLPMYGGMVLVFIAGYLIIFNIFQISVASDIAFYGKLKTLGTTKKQIRSIILGQGNRLALSGIPAGLVLGYLLGVVLVPVWMTGMDAQPSAAADPVVFVGSALFSYVTVITSCLLPARLAGKVSPMEALRYTDADTNVKKKIKKTKKGASLAGMAWANLWRNRKRTILVICSLTLGLVLMSFFYAKNASFDIEKYLLDLAAADFQLDDATNASSGGYDPESHTISDALLDKISGLESLEETGRLYSHEISMSLSEEAKNNFLSFYTKERLDEFASYDLTFSYWKEGFDAAVNGEEVPHTIYGADGLLLEAAASENYILDGTYDAEKFAGGDYVLAIGPSVEPQTGLPSYSVGETVMIENREFTVMAVLDSYQPMVEGAAPSFDIPLIISGDTFLELWPDSNVRKFYFNVADDDLEQVSEMLTDYQQTEGIGMDITSRQAMVEQYEAQTRSASVMGYAISIVVALVGVLNFVNSMVTAIIARKREFAMIQSIGMTKRQLCQMLTCEGLSYAGLTLAASYVIGSVTVGVIVRALVADGFSTFHFTLTPLILCTPILIALAILIPYLCFKNLDKKSIVERLRM